MAALTDAPTVYDAAIESFLRFAFGRTELTPIHLKDLHRIIDRMYRLEGRTVPLHFTTDLGYGDIRRLEDSMNDRVMLQL